MQESSITSASLDWCHNASAHLPPQAERRGGSTHLWCESDDSSRRLAGLANGLKHVEQSCSGTGQGGSKGDNRVAAQEISIEAFGSVSEFVHHKGGKVSVDPVLTLLDSANARFKKVPGLADGKGVSFESTNEPGRYLVHRNGRLILTQCPEPTDKRDATFLVRKGLAYDGDGWISLGPLTFPGHFLHARNGELFTGARHGGVDFVTSATFRFAKPAYPRNPPLPGKAARGIHLFDALMQKYGAMIGCTSAELAVARYGVVILSRGYGSSDRFGRVPMHPNNPMAIASCEKPVTAAAIKQLAHSGKLDLNASAFKVLKIQPVGPIVDNRIWDITIQHLVDHKAGWQGAPFDQAVEAARASGITFNDTEIWLRFLMVQRLKDAPVRKKSTAIIAMMSYVC